MSGDDQNPSVDILMRGSDLVRINLIALPQQSTVILLYATIYHAFATLAYLCIVSTISVREDIVESYFSSLILFIILFILLMAFSVVYGAYKLSKHYGFLGLNTYVNREDGLLSKNEAHQSIQKWRSFRSVKATQRTLFIEMGDYRIHVIEARHFASKSDFRRFCDLATERFRGASKST